MSGLLGAPVQMSEPNCSYLEVTRCRTAGCGRCEAPALSLLNQHNSWGGAGLWGCSRMRWRRRDRSGIGVGQGAGDGTSSSAMTEPRKRLAGFGVGRLLPAGQGAGFVGTS
jgi:hypothetical protein